ncbi:MAG: pseudouridine synthase [Methylophilus sp.]|nr:pseudouridine synthase [Methylophilus sp.]
MTTLKLNKNSTKDTVVKAEKAPVRRADPSKRDRSKPLPITKPVSQKTTEKFPEKAQQSTPPSVANKSSQRNHRYDGKPREVSEQAPVKTSHTDARVPLKTSREEPQYRQAPTRGGKARDGFDARAPRNIKQNDSPSSADNLPRLSKVMAERGLCSRREADDWIVNGWVKVNGEIIETLGTRISPDAEIIISAYAKEYQAENVTILLHKPVGYVSGQAEDGYEPAVVLIHPENQWEEDTSKKSFNRGHLKGLAPAGRLDIDSTGLLVLTQDGRIARHLIGDDSTVEKEYLVRVEGELSHEDLTKLNYGLSLDGVKLKPAKVSWQNEDQLRFVLREGKKRQIRRMCEMVGLKVVGLKRIRIGSVNLGKLPVGQWRFLRADERF